MPRKTRNPDRLPKYSRRPVTTVTDILTRDDVNDILSNITKQKDSIKHMIVITIDKEELYSWWTTDDTTMSTAIFMLESTKLELFNSDNGG
jgi:archaellum biogenesis ATPase FlaH